MPSEEPEQSRRLFRDFDDPEVYQQTKNHVAKQDAKNFVVEFDFHSIHIGFDLTGMEMSNILQQSVPENRVRWINIWSPGAQGEVIHQIASKYNFSRRLEAVLRMPSSRPAPSDLSASTAVSHVERVIREDVELAEVSAHGSSAQQQPLSEDEAIRKLVDKTMGYMSTDKGQEFLCIGANWLHRPCLSDTIGHELPPKHWSWLTLCADNTVISIHEAPRFENPGDPRLRQEEVSNMRSNTNSILCQLSRCSTEDYKKNVLTLKTVRDLLCPPRTTSASNMRRMTSNFDTSDISDPVTEGASNLFYYLFEDYSGAVPALASAQEYLKRLAVRVFKSADRGNKVESKDIIRDLHQLSKQLRGLSHLFESYKSLVQGISRPRSQLNGFEVPAGPHRLSGNVMLSQSARDRFERLGERLQLLMLNTIHECLEEVKALSQTYFSLTAQKDSQATARLTRSATLLAKLSVFFLPINFITSYFSMEIPDMMDDYTPNTYWACFGVAIALSFVALFFFSRLLMFLSESLEEWAHNSGLRVHNAIRSQHYGFKKKYGDNTQ